MRGSHYDSSPSSLCSESFGLLAGPSAGQSVVFSHLIRRGGAPSGAAALLACGGMGYQPPSYGSAKARSTLHGSLAEDSGKRAAQQLKISKNVQVQG